jgi:hypothetical protein
MSTPIAVTLTLCYVALLHLFTYTEIERFAMSIQDQINALVEQLRKSKDEIVARLGEAEANIGSQLVDAGVADQVDLSELTDIAQALDDIVPDAVDVTTLPDEAVDVTTLPGEEDSTEVSFRPAPEVGQRPASTDDVELVELTDE